MDIQKQHFKDQSPDRTIEKLKGILTDLELETEEIWQEESSINTNALRVEFKGTKVGTNGKGILKEYALASAYAELFERYQNGLLIPPIMCDSEYVFSFGPDEKWLDSNELIKNESSFLKHYFKLKGMNHKSFEEKKKVFTELQKIDYIIWGKNDSYITLPFYNVRTEKLEYLPRNTYQAFYGSNGMCAGNTPEEAIVQGIAEIIERVVQKKIFYEKPSLPDIPIEYIKKFPNIYKMYKKLNENNKYIYMLKDCSFGGKYPVAALIIIEKSTGKFGIKLGCHPDYGIAMERAFTESAQGQDVYAYVNRSYIDFQNKGVDDWKNIYNSFKVGKAQYPYQIFIENDVLNPFTQVKDVSLLSNSELLSNWISEILNLKYEVLIRDVSYLGFPSYHVIIPGLSEMLNPDEMHVRAFNTRCLMSKYLGTNVSAIGVAEAKYMISLIDFFSGNIFENTMSSFYTIMDANDLPCENLGAGCLYMAAMCYVIIGDYESANRNMKQILQDAGKCDKNIDANKIKLYHAMSTYFSAMLELKDNEKAMEYIKIFYDDITYTEIHGLFSDISLLIIKQYPDINIYKSQNYKDYNVILAKKTKIVNALKKAQANSNINQKELRKLFHNVKVT